MTASITRQTCIHCSVDLELDEPHVVEPAGSRHIDREACRHALRIANLSQPLRVEDDICLACWCPHPNDVDCEGQPLEVVTVPVSLLRELDEREDEIVEQAIRALTTTPVPTGTSRPR